MKRYPHVAILTIESAPEMVNGKRKPSQSIAVSCVGRYDPKNSGVGEIVKNDNGDEILISGEFYTRSIPCVDGKIVNLRIASLGIDKPVIGPPTVYQRHVILKV